MGNNPNPNRFAGLRQRRRQGQGLVELALILPFLLVLTLGIVDVGVLISDRYNVLYSSREAARVGAANACFRDDLSVMQRVAAVLRNKPLSDIGDITVFKADASGQSTGPYMQYHIIQITPVFTYTTSDHGWSYVHRHNNIDYTDPVPGDWLGVTVVYTHHPITLVGEGLWGRNMRGSEKTVMRVEPPEKADGTTDCVAP